MPSHKTSYSLPPLQTRASNQRKKLVQWFWNYQANLLDYNS
jgi:hypothetical protein